MPPWDFSYMSQSFALFSLKLVFCHILVTESILPNGYNLTAKHAHALPIGEDEPDRRKRHRRKDSPLPPHMSMSLWQPRHKARPHPVPAHEDLPAAWPAPARRAWSCECGSPACGSGGSSQEARGPLYSQCSAPTWCSTHAGTST